MWWDNFLEIIFISEPWLAWTCFWLKTICFSDPFLSYVITIAKKQQTFLYILANTRIHKCWLRLSVSVKNILPIIIANATWALEIFYFNFCDSICLNLLHSISNQAIRSNSKIIIMLDCKSLHTEIGFSNTILLFNKSVIGCSSFFLPNLFEFFCLFLFFKIS